MLEILADDALAPGRVIARRYRLDRVVGEGGMGIVWAACKPVTPVTDVTEEQIRAALARAGGKRERAWRDLGLANRHVLKRLIRKYKIETPSDEEDDD